MGRKETAGQGSRGPMVRSTLDIHPERRETGDHIRYEFLLRYDGIAAREELLFYEFSRDNAPSPVDNYDGVLCAVLLHAMAQGRDIRLHGPATSTALLNLDELQLAWCRWLPQRYRPVGIEVDTIINSFPRPTLRTICAFSGGVDSTFTLLHAKARTVEPRYAVDTVLLVHGFDVFLSNDGALRELIGRTSAVREAAGVQLRVVRTNSKELRLQKWEHSHGLELAACLHLFSADFSNAMIASSKPYDALVLPYGSNPVTDHLLSGGSLRIVHDGAAFSRMDKIAFLMKEPAALRSLKVCWEGEHQGRNCGICEKCVRTRLNFMALGMSNPPCFDTPLDLQRIPNMWIDNDATLAEIKSILDYVRSRNMEAAWVQMLRDRFQKGKNTVDWRKKLSLALSRLGLLGLTKTT